MTKPEPPLEFFPDGTPGWVGEQGYIAARHLEDEEWLVVLPMLFSLRLAVATEGDAALEHWCFSTVGQALVAFLSYPHVPEGWTRHWGRDRKSEQPTWTTSA